MRVDGREITVSGSLLQPLTRRTNDIVRVVLAALFLAVVITSSLITRNEWDALEKSVSEIVAVLTPTQSNLVYLVYGVAILALPFVILVSLIVARQWKLLGAYAAAAAIAGLALSITGAGIAAPQWHFDLSERLDTLPVPVPRRPALDRDARRGAHRLRPMAARPVATLVVGAAAGVRAHPPGHQRRGARAVTARPGGRLVRRRAGRPRRRHPRSRGAAGRRGPGDGPAWVSWCRP